MTRLAILCQEEPIFLGPFLIGVMVRRPQQVAVVFVAGTRSGGEHRSSWRDRILGLATWACILEHAFLRCLLYRLRARLLGAADPRSIRAAARRLGIPVVDGVDPRSPDFPDHVRASGATVLLNQSEILLPRAVIEALPGGCVNRHASLLPAHRGRLAGWWVHVDHRPCYGFTIHRISDRLDDGPMLHQESLPSLDPTWHYPRIMRALQRRAAAVLWSALDHPPAPAPPLGDQAPHRFPTWQEARRGCRRLLLRRRGNGKKSMPGS